MCVACREPPRSQHGMFLRVAAVVVAATTVCYGAYTCEPEVLGVNRCDTAVGPASGGTAEYYEWWNSLRAWGDRRLLQLREEQPVMGDFHAYSNPDIDWARTAYVQPQSMIHDRYLYDRSTGVWTVDRFLNDLEERYGGIDAVLLWQGYPNLGADDQNNFDMLRNLPGGVEGVRSMIEDFHERGVKVLWPNFVWDTQTRPEGLAQHEALARLCVATDCDGINGDTMDGLNVSFWNSGLLEGKGLALEAQSMGRRNVPEGWTNVTFNVNSWAEGWSYGRAPLISTYKLLDSRHTASITERSQTNRSAGIQHAFFNGIGYTSWENVWGFFNQIAPRYAETLRRTSTLMREFSDLLGGSTYLPHIPYSLVDGVYAAQFGTDEATLLMVVNRNGDPAGDRSGDILRVPCVSGARWFDVYHGHEMTVACADGFAVLRFRIEALGYGAVLRCTNTAPTCIPTTGYMERMRELTRSELRTFTDRWQHLPQTMAPSSATPVPAGGVPAGMVMLPGGDLEFDASYGGRPSPGVPFSGDVQFPWEPSPRTNHRQLLAMHPLYMDIHPVTNQQYAEYLSASGYNPPVSSQNWLRHWPAGPSGGPPPDWENKPVTWVSRDDASAYCQYFNKRLPHTWEYQWAAQGQLEDESIYFPPSYDGAMMNHSLVTNLNRTRPNRRRLDEAPPPPPPGEFPWCRIGLPCEDDPTRYPPRSNNGVQPPPEDVGGYPSGASAFGVQDLMYSVWQWTDEFCDEHTCVSLVRGGSNYAHSPAGYYFPRPTSLGTHQTWIMQSEAMDRKGTFSFRCVADAVVPPTCPWQLCGEVVSMPPGLVIDLTTLGEGGDWVHWGRRDARDVDYMARPGGGPPTIMATVLHEGPRQPERYSDDAFPGLSLGFSWINGATHEREPRTATGIFVTEASQLGGFRISVPTVAGDDYMTLRLYVGALGAQGKLKATLASGEVQYEKLWPEDGPSALPRKAAFTLRFRSTDAWPLSITWALVDSSSSSGHVSLLSAALTPTSME